MYCWTNVTVAFAKVGAPKAAAAEAATRAIFNFIITPDQAAGAQPG
jgi:hypothetical protein